MTAAWLQGAQPWADFKNTTLDHIWGPLIPVRALFGGPQSRLQLRTLIPDLLGNPTINHVGSLALTMLCWAPL